MATLALRRDQLKKFCRVAKIKNNKELAERMHIHWSNVYRTINGSVAPGPRFIAGLLEVFGIECFSDLFEVIPSDDNQDAA